MQSCQRLIIPVAAKFVFIGQPTAVQQTQGANPRCRPLIRVANASEPSV